MIIRTEAVVLRAIDYSETSQIVTLFTREKGKVTVIAKGSRRPKSKFGSTLQPMAYTQVVFYHRETRSLQTLSESAFMEPLLDIRRDLEKITIGLRMVELIAGLMQEEDPQPQIFNLLIEGLRRLNAARVRAANVLPYFQLRLASLMGFRPDVQREQVEALPPAGGRLALGSGAPLPAERAPADSHEASRAALRAYAVFARASLDDVMRMDVKPPVRREVEGLVDAYLRYHLQDAYPDRSRDVIRRLFDA